jgi:hypothetical protein
MYPTRSRPTRSGSCIWSERIRGVTCGEHRHGRARSLRPVPSDRPGRALPPASRLGRPGRSGAGRYLRPHGPRDHPWVGEGGTARHGAPGRIVGLRSGRNHPTGPALAWERGSQRPSGHGLAPGGAHPGRDAHLAARGGTRLCCLQPRRGHPDALAAEIGSRRGGRIEGLQHEASHRATGSSWPPPPQAVSRRGGPTPPRHRIHRQPTRSGRIR